VEYLQYTVNTRKVPHFEAVAIQGDGVFDTLSCICTLVLAQMPQKQKAGTI
jgi:hypothetical protein